MCFYVYFFSCQKHFHSVVMNRTVFLNLIMSPPWYLFSALVIAQQGRFWGRLTRTEHNRVQLHAHWTCIYCSREDLPAGLFLVSSRDYISFYVQEKGHLCCVSYKQTERNYKLHSVIKLILNWKYWVVAILLLFFAFLFIWWQLYTLMLRLDGQKKMGRIDIIEKCCYWYLFSTRGTTF